MARLRDAALWCPAPMMLPKRRVLFVALALLVLAGLGLFARRWLQQPPPAAQFVGTAACASCHQGAFDKWQQSHHRHAMEVAGAQSVLGDFQNTTFDYFGTTSRFFTRDGQYFVETDNAQGTLETFRIAYTFGWYPLQQYLIEFPDGRMQALSISWDSRPASEGGQRWYHLYPDEPVRHDDPLHWTGAFQNWNSRCAACHSTDLVKGYRQDENRYETRWKEMNVGCEACHGPGSRHLAWANGQSSLQNKGLTTRIGALWAATAGQRPGPQQADAPMSAQVQVCASCHSRRSELQQPDIAAGFFENYSLSPLLDVLYFHDGQIRDEVYETGSFLQSRMHQNHVSCTNCHEPHSNRLRATGNGPCLQCHEPAKFQSRAHFFHEPESAGAQCVNCHMPQRTYMGVDARRDHSFRIPDPVASLRLGVPNVCTQCHTDRDDRWAADFMTQRTGRSEPRYPHAALLAAARRNVASAAPALLAYARDSSRPPILRAIALQEGARFPSPQHLDEVAGAMGSPDPLLRAAAASALGSLGASERLARLKPLMTDPVKSVRVATARQLIDVRPEQAPEEMRPALGRLFDEYRASLLHNADMPESVNELALFQSAQGDLDAAEKSLLRARKLSPRFLPAMLNLADLYRVRNRDDLGEALLREALGEYPESGDVRHVLGLLYVRTGRTAESIALFRQAAALAPDNAQYALVYAIALIETGSRAEGISALDAAAQRFPDNEQIRQAVAGYRLQQP